MPSAANSVAKPLVGIIADDLTGAAELAGVAWRFGFTAEIHTDSTSPTSAEVIAIDTDSRHCDTAEAARRVVAAAQHLKALGVEWIYKKVDSVLRGSVLVETEALLDTLKLDRALLVPANPGLGRVVRDGNYFIAGTPVHETDFRNDPQHPRTSSRILEMLGRSNSRLITVCRPEQPLPAGGIIVGEAASKDDLQAWAAKWDSTILPVGAAEFFAAVLRSKMCGEVLRPISAPVLANGPILFVCGSLSASTQDFLDDCRQRGWPVFPMSAGLLDEQVSVDESVQAWAQEVVTALRQHGQSVMAIDLPRVKAGAGRLTGLLMAAVKTVLRETPVAQINAEGGATAVALMQAMGWNRLQVLREVSPGVVTLRVGPDGNIAFTMKPGSYKWPAALCL